MNVLMLLKSKSHHKGATVVTATPIMTLAEAASLLAAHKIGAVVVADPNNAIAGILSERDIVRALAQSGAAALAKPVGEIMTRTVITCTADDSVDELMKRMTRGRFRHMPVVDGAGHLAGVVSIGDVVKHHVEEIEHEASVLREYISTH